MQKLSVMLKDCRVEEVLGELVAGMSPKKRSAMLERYFSVYCMILEKWNPSGKHDVILMDFKEEKHGSYGEKNQFYGVRDYRKAAFRGGTLLDPDQVIKSGRKRIREINWEKVIRPEADGEVLIPDCLLEAVGDTSLVVLILKRIEQAGGEKISVRTNRILMNRIKKKTPVLSGRIAVLERTVKHRFRHRVSHEFLIDEIREYAELAGEVMQWEDLLESAKADQPVFRQPVWDDDPDDISALSEKLIKCLLELDQENPIRPGRAIGKIRELNRRFRHLELSEFQNAQLKKQRILVEQNPSAGKLPLVCVRSRSGAVCQVQDVSLSELLCMEIHVLDKTCVKEERVLALLLFNLLFPIRVMRLQK